MLGFRNMILKVKPLSLILVGAPIISTSISNSKCDISDGDDKKVTDDSPTVSLYLNKSSISKLKEYIQKLDPSIKQVDVSQVIIRHSCAKKEDCYEYEPMFGERAAFRLKGFARTDAGLIAVSFS